MVCEVTIHTDGVKDVESHILLHTLIVWMAIVHAAIARTADMHAVVLDIYLRVMRGYACCDGAYSDCTRQCNGADGLSSICQTYSCQTYSCAALVVSC